MDQVKFDILINATPAQKALNKFASTVTKVVTKVDKQLSGLDRHLTNVSKSLNALNGNSMKGFNRGVTAANKNLSILEKRMAKISSMSAGGGNSPRNSKGAAGGANRFVSGAMGLVGGYTAFGLMGMIGGAAKSGNEFESSMADIKGILANAEGGFGSLDDKIREVGRTSAFTINQMGDAAKFMAMAGMGGGDIGNTLKSVSNLGMVGNLDAGRSADIMTNIMSSMGIDTKQSGAVTDILTATFTNSNVSIEELGQSFAYTGNIAAQTGISINETAAAIGILGNAGIKASKAGTNLRQMFLRLAAPTKKGRDTIESLGLNLYKIGKDGHRALRPISDILSEFGKTNAGVKEFTDIFGVRGGQAFGALIGGAEEYRSVLKDIAGSGGLTDQLAEKKMATTSGKTLVMKSKWEDLSITLMEKVRPAYNFVIDGISKLIDKLQGSERFLNFVEGAANGIAVAMKAAYYIAKFLFNFIIDNSDFLIKLLATLTAGMVAFGIASAAASLANPFTAMLIEAAALLIVADKIANHFSDPLKLSQREDVNKIQKEADVLRKLHASGKSGLTREEYISKQDELQKRSMGLNDLSEDQLISRFWAKKKFPNKKYSDLTYDEAASLPKNRPETQGILDKAMAAGKSIVAPKGSGAEKLLKQLDEINSKTTVNLGNGGDGGSGTNEGDAIDTMSKASPLTSAKNEMSRSVIVNMDNLVGEVNVNGAIGSSETSTQLEEQVSEIFIKVVRDFELGMSQ